MCDARRLLGYQRPVPSRKAKADVEAESTQAAGMGGVLCRERVQRCRGAEVQRAECICGVEHDGREAYDLTGQKCQRVFGMDNLADGE